MYVSDSKSASGGIIIISDCNSCNISSLDKYFLTLVLLPYFSFFSSQSLEVECIYIYMIPSQFQSQRVSNINKISFHLHSFSPIEQWTLNGLWSSIQWIKSWTWDRNYIHKFIFFVYRSELLVQFFFLLFFTINFIIIVVFYVITVK